MGDYRLSNAFLSGEIDWVSANIYLPSPDNPDELSLRNQHPHRHWAATLNTYYAAINHEWPLNDVRVRQALTLAINRQKVSEVIVPSTMVQGVMPTLITNYPHLSTWPANPDLFNPTLARQLLAEAGFPGGEGLPALTLMSVAGGGVPAFSYAIAQSWRDELGMEIEEIGLSYADYLEQRHTSHLYLGNIISSVPDSLVFIAYFNGNYIRTPYSSPHFTSLLRQIFAAATLEERMALTALAEELFVVQDQAIIPLVSDMYRANIIDLERWSGFGLRNNSVLNTWVGIRVREEN